MNYKQNNRFSGNNGGGRRDRFSNSDNRYSSNRGEREQNKFISVGITFSQILDETKKSVLIKISEENFKKVFADLEFSDKHQKVWFSKKYLWLTGKEERKYLSASILLEWKYNNDLYTGKELIELLTGVSYVEKNLSKFELVNTDDIEKKLKD
ncbi:MAG: hypothetical protein ACRCW6_01185 [Mycoplasmoidaceae bacterium]